MRTPAIGETHFFFELLGLPAGHDALVGGHHDGCLGRVAEQLGVGAADVDLRRQADQLGGAAVADQHPALPVLGVHHAGRGFDEGTQQGLGMIPLRFDPAALIDIDQYPGEADGLPLRVEVHPADRLDPAIGAVGAAGSILVGVAATAADRFGNRLGQAGAVVGVDGGHDLLQAQLAAGQRRVEAMGQGQGIVDRQAVLGNIPEPGTDDRTGSQCHPDALGITLAVGTGGR